MRLNSSVSTLFLSALIGIGCGGSSSPSDAGSTGNAGSGGGDGGAFTAIAPCANASDYVSGMTAITTTATTFVYSPACLKVTAGTMVTIDASAFHPLVGLTTGSANNPIPAGPSMTPQAVTFTTPGFYPFHCNVHFALGMAGVVWVQ